MTPLYTLQHNSVSKKRNCTRLDMVRSMMSFTDLPIYLWGYALQTTLHVLNKAPSKSIRKTSYELWYDKLPSVNYLKIWGCPTFVKVLRTDKLES